MVDYLLISFGAHFVNEWWINQTLCSGYFAKLILETFGNLQGIIADTMWQLFKLENFQNIQ